MIAAVLEEEAGAMRRGVRGVSRERLLDSGAEGRKGRKIKACKD